MEIFLFDFLAAKQVIASFFYLLLAELILSACTGDLLILVSKLDREFSV